MYFLLFILTIMVVYIVSFKDGFDKEVLSKASTGLVLIAVAIVISVIMSAIGARGR